MKAKNTRPQHAVGRVLRESVGGIGREGLRRKAVEIFGGSLGVSGGGENRLAVGFQNLEPGGQVRCVFGHHIGRDPQIRTHERGSQFRNQFFDGVAVIAEPLRLERAIQAAFVFRPVRVMSISA